jgi:predicted RNase H-like nuclease (RuvC/YqgF family)
MTSEARVHITAKIPSELHDLMLQRISENKYKDKTDCVTVSLENELRNTQREAVRNTDVSHMRDTKFEELKHVLQEKHDEIERLKIELAQASNPVELAELHARNEELQAHNKTLKNELEKAGQRYDNYMAQMQTLIKQKAIEPPGAKKPWWRFW